MKKKSFQEKLRFLLLRNLPVKKNTVMFKSFAGQYGDNPRYVSEKLHEIRPDLNIVWVTSEESSGTDYPDYVKTIRYDSWAYDYYAATSIVIVDNMSGIRAFRQKSERSYRELFLRREGQLNLCTWHGTPLKHIGVQENPAVSIYQTSARYMSSGNEYCFEIFKKAFPGIAQVKYGTPRNDIFFHPVNGSELRRKLGLPEDRKLLLYAPTFRFDVNSSGVDQLLSLDLETLLKALSESFEGEWSLVIRLHHEVLSALHERFSAFVDNDRVFDGTLHDDIGSYLSVCDALLTDYSSSFFDLCLSDKPVFLMAQDKERYIAQERGLYLSLEELPFAFSESPEDLYDHIRHYDERSELERRSAFLEGIGNFEDGHASERFAEDIVKFIEERT